MLPFNLTQEYPLYRDGDGTMSVLINNISDDTLLVKVLASKQISGNLFLNQSFFPLFPRSCEKVIGSYKGPISDPCPRLSFQAITIGEQDPILFETPYVEQRKRFWDKNLAQAKENNAFYELPITLNFIDGKQQTDLDPKLKNLQLKDKLRDALEEAARLHGVVASLKTDVFMQDDALAIEKTCLEQREKRILELKIRANQRQVMRIPHFGGIQFSHLVVALACVVGALLALKLRK